MDSDSSLTSLKKPIELVTKAIEEDRNRNYEESLRFYEHSIECFMHAIEDEAQRENVKENVRNKCCQYSERAEKIRDYLNKSKKKPIEDGQNNNDEEERDSDSDYEDEEKKKLQLKLEHGVVVEKPHIKWSDVAGLDETKEALKKAVIFPIRFPHLFPGKKIPWKGVLLIGPPGSGKSYLAKAIATETKNTMFFSVSLSDVFSKCLGEADKCPKNLFELALQHKPCIIFIDELDFLCSAGLDNESESTKRIKTEFLEQIQDISHDSEGILLLGATNMPWTLDAAVQRYFEKCIYFPLPEEHDRLVMFELHLGNAPTQLTEEDFNLLVQKTEGYSGADITAVVRDALRWPVCKVHAATHFKIVTGPSPEDPDIIMDNLLTPCSPDDPDAIEMTWVDIDDDKLYQPPLTMSDMLKSIESSKPTVGKEYLEVLEKFREDSGQEG